MIYDTLSKRSIFFYISLANTIWSAIVGFHFPSKHSLLSCVISIVLKTLYLQMHMQELVNFRAPSSFSKRSNLIKRFGFVIHLYVETKFDCCFYRVFLQTWNRLCFKTCEFGSADNGLVQQMVSLVMHDVLRALLLPTWSAECTVCPFCRLVL